MVDSRSLLHAISILRLPMGRVQHPHVGSHRLLVHKRGRRFNNHIDVPGAVHPFDVRRNVRAGNARVAEGADLQLCDEPCRINS